MKTTYNSRALISALIAIVPLVILVAIGQQVAIKITWPIWLIWPFSLYWAIEAGRNEKKSWYWLFLLSVVCYWPVSLLLYVFLVWRIGGFAP
jgi:hypothetical protein